MKKIIIWGMTINKPESPYEWLKELHDYTLSILIGLLGAFLFVSYVFFAGVSVYVLQLAEVSNYALRIIGAFFNSTVILMGGVWTLLLFYFVTRDLKKTRERETADV